MVYNKKKNMTTSSSATHLLGATLGAILVFAASPATAQPRSAPWTTDCSKKPAEDFYNCQYCTDQIPSRKGVYFSTASTNRVSQKNTLECKPPGDSIAEANAPAPSDGMWSNSSYDRVQACLAIPASQRADLVEEGFDNDLNTNWRTPNDQVCTANANQGCQDYATAAYLMTNTWADKYGGDACFFYLNDEGPTGPRWSKSWKAHYDWCVAQSASGNMQAVTQEGKIRLGTIDYCQKQNGQPNIDQNTAQPVPSPGPPQRTHAFGSPVPVPPAVTDKGNTMPPGNPANPFASGSGSGLGASGTNRQNPFGSGGAGGGPNTGGFDGIPRPLPNPRLTPNGGNTAGSGGASGGPNTGGFDGIPRPLPNPRLTTNGGNSGAGGAGGGPNTGGFNGTNAQPKPLPNPRLTPNGGNSGAGGTGGGTNTGGFNPTNAQPKPQKNPVLSTNRPNPFAPSPVDSGTNNVRSLQIHSHGGRHSSGRHSSGHHSGGHHGGGHHSGRHRSDIRLKHDIALLGRLDSGLGFYRFSYNGSNKVYVGVMAQEVQAVVPEAVERGRDGYLLVLYSKLGLQFQTYEQWIASGAHVPSGSTLQH